jgi:hypothetical protein
MDRIINVKVRGHYLTKDNNKAGVQGEANATHLHIEFNPSWEGLAKSVIFFNAHGQFPVKVTLTTNDICASDIVPGEGVYVTYDVAIPREAMTEHGWAEFTLEGVKEGVVAKTLTDKLYVHEAPDTTYVEEPTEPPSPTELEKMQAQLESILENILLATEASEASEDSAEKAAASANAAASSANAAAALAGEAAESAKALKQAELEMNDAEDEMRRAAAELEAVDGVYVGSGTPPERASVWIDPTGRPTGTEAWEFDMEDGTTEIKTVVVV